MTRSLPAMAETEQSAATVAARRGTPNRRRTILVFDRVLEDPEIPRALESAGFEVIRTRSIANTQGHPADRSRIDVILAGIHDLDEASRRLIEHLRAERAPGRPLLVFGLASPVVAAMARGRRKALPRHARERRGGSPKRHVFDDFISTPFEVSRLVYLIRAWEVAFDTRQSSGQGPPVAADAIETLVTLGGSMLVRELVDLSFGTLPELVKDIRKALASHDAEAMRKSAHDLESASGLFGAGRIREIAGLLEAMGLVGCQDGAHKLADSLEEELAQFRRHMQSCHELSGARVAEAAPSGPHVREMADVFRGRSVVEYGLEAPVAERLGAVVRTLEGSYVRVARAAWDEASRHADLKILYLGPRDHGEVASWRAALEVRDGVPVLLVLGDTSGLLAGLARLADNFVAPPGEVSRLLGRAYQVLLHRDRRSPGPAPADAPPLSSEPPTTEARPHLLVAEDDPLTARFLVGSLRANGFEVTHALNGQEAIDACTARAFTAAVLDVTMPEVDGYGVLAHIRQSPLHKSMPVLMLSARTQERDILKALELGADDYVTKPFSPPEVALRLRKMLGKR